MKNKKVLIVAVSSLSTVLISSIAYGALSGSAHDFSGESWNSGGEMCIVCHTPHNAISETNAPLWNHTSTTATYTLYTSGTLDATIGQPAGASKMCLSCHDGTVALDSYGGATGTTDMTGSTLLDTDLRNDHPIGFSYTKALSTTDGELSDPEVSNTTLGNSIQNELLISDVMHCSSCHDVHNTAGNDSLLVIANTGSQLCLVCHVK